jgi:hypothetical protein
MRFNLFGLTVTIEKRDDFKEVKEQLRNGMLLKAIKTYKAIVPCNLITARRDVVAIAQSIGITKWD